MSLLTFLADNGYVPERDINTYGDLHDYYTAEVIRPATKEELEASIGAAERDGGAGVITVDDQGDRRCYVV